MKGRIARTVAILAGSGFIAAASAVAAHAARF